MNTVPPAETIPATVETKLLGGKFFNFICVCGNKITLAVGGEMVCEDCKRTWTLSVRATSPGKS